MFNSALTSALLLGAAAALPSNAPYHSSSEKVQANFDDITTLLGVPLLTPSGVYKELNYKAFEVVQLGVDGLVVTGLVPPTKPNVIGAGIQDQILKGPPEITTTDSVKSFDLHSFYFGCVLDTAVSAASVVPACTITVTGYNEHGDGVANQEFTFAKSELRGNMQKAVLSPDFNHLHRVHFSTDTTLAPLTSTLYDSFSYTYHKGGYY